VPRLSIITVSLNSAPHIRRAIESVLAQHDRTFELLVIDGGSTDGTLAIVEGYRMVLGDRLVFVSERDSGLYDAMNKGIALATGEIVGILNSDDEYLPGALAAVRQAFTSHEADVVFGNVLVDGDTPQLRRASIAGLRERMTVLHPGCFVRRSAYRTWGAFDTRYRIAADYDFLLRCHLQGARFVHLDRPVTRFAMGGASSRSFKLAREMYAIHSRQLSTPHALYCFVKRASKVSFFAARRAIGTALLGQSGYAALRRRWRRMRNDRSV